MQNVQKYYVGTFYNYGTINTKEQAAFDEIFNEGEFSNYGTINTSYIIHNDGSFNNFGSIMLIGFSNYTQGYLYNSSVGSLHNSGNISSSNFAGR